MFQKLFFHLIAITILLSGSIGFCFSVSASETEMGNMNEMGIHTDIDHSCCPDHLPLSAKMAPTLQDTNWIKNEQISYIWFLSDSQSSNK